MIIAIPYENGQINQHFGHSAQFKLYTVELGIVTSSEVIDVPEGSGGHDGISAFLAGKGVKAVVCGGIGDGAQGALANAGIILCSGASGDPDAAVNAFLNGDLETQGANCSKHENGEEGEGCGCGCGGGCGGDEGGCGGGCGGGYVPPFDGPNVGKAVRVHYHGTFDDGSVFDSSYDRGETLNFTCGAGMMIEGFDKAVATMKEGDIVNVRLAPEEAYGPVNPNAIINVKIADLPGSEDLVVGQSVYLRNTMGQPFQCTVTEKTEEDITFDANHPMAGKTLNFKIELVQVED